MIRICTECGALLLEDADNCSFCDAPLVETGENLEPVAVGAASHGLGASSQASFTGVQSAEPEWRREVSRRLEDYRARRRHLRPDDSQSGLPFSRQSKIDEEEAARERQREAERQRQAERPRTRKRLWCPLRISPSAAKPACLTLYF